MNRERTANRTSQRPLPGSPPAPTSHMPFPHLPGSRPYMAGVGRWLTQVRLQEQLQGEHPYAYANNNPVTYTDPSGNSPTYNPPWLNGPIGTKAKGCLSSALQNQPYCKGLSSQQQAWLNSLMICIMGCETSGPGNLIPNNPMLPDDPKHPNSGGQGPCRLTTVWKNLYHGHWRTNLCDNVSSGANLLCFYYTHLDQFGFGKPIDKLPRFPWYQDTDNGCLGNCISDRKLGPYPG